MSFPETLKINVTEADIAAGFHSDPNRCPVALSIIRDNPGYGCAVSAFDVQMWRRDGSVFDKNHVYMQSSELYQFVIDFDRQRPVSPFKTTLNNGPLVLDH